MPFYLCTDNLYPVDLDELIDIRISYCLFRKEMLPNLYFLQKEQRTFSYDTSAITNPFTGEGSSNDR